jgi:hypothetical protein
VAGMLTVQPDCTTELVADWVGDCVYGANLEATRGPIIGRHMEPQIGPISHGQKLFGLLIDRSPDLTGKQ